jgi:hypothetical protein
MADPAAPDLESVHLHLCALAAIDQKSLVVQGYHLRRRMAIVHG